MRFLLRLLGVLIVVYAALSVIRSVVGMIAPKRPLRATSGGRLVKDPVCGTYVPEESALKAANEFFCSEECRQKFIKA